MTWLLGLLARRRARLLGSVAGVALAVALLASIGSFVGAAESTMTARSAARVPVDWQVLVQPGADPNAVLQTIRRSPLTQAAAPVGYATVSGLHATVQGAALTTGSAQVLGLPAAYRSLFPGEIRSLVGAGSGVLLDQQTAANLHATPGTMVTIDRGALPPVDVRVDGVVSLLQADSLFQNVGAPANSQPGAPPDNVVVLPPDTWHRLFDPIGRDRPQLVRNQVHVRISHNLPSDPVSAYTEAQGAARNLESRLAGAGVVGDNLSAALGAARSDALYAEVLFVLLGAPGAILAALLTAVVAASGAERRRREMALLRARGATLGRLIRLALAEAAFAGVLGALAGLAAAWVIGRVAFGSSGFGATPSQAAVWAGGSALVGLTIAALSMLIPAWRDARRLTVAAARQGISRRRVPGWARYTLEGALLAGAGGVFWLINRQGYQLVLAPEGLPQIAVSYWALAGPALLWTGAGLLAWHLGERLLSDRRILLPALRPLAGPLAGTVSSTMARQRHLLARALTLVALTAAFAASTAIFNSTYAQQARVDALLTNGADVRVGQPPGASVPPSAAGALKQVPGVSSVEPLQHRFAYVGTDLQDLYGVRASSIVQATQLQDGYFQGGTARELIGRLARQPDAILVSAETARTFQLQQGDRITLRLQDRRTHAYVPVQFHYVGVVKEFPTAPKDSFLIANDSYVATMTGSNAVGDFLVTTDGTSPRTVGDRIRAGVPPSVQVTDISSTAQIIGSSLTAVDLAGLTRVELAFALALAAAASGLVLALGLIERRRTFAIASALGAKTRQLGAFVWSEVGFVTAGGLLAGAFAGWALSEMLLAVLTGVFDPPPDRLAVPWGYLIGVAGLSIIATAVAAVVAIRQARRSSASVLRDL